MKKILLGLCLVLFCVISCKKETEYHEIAEEVNLPEPKVADNNVVAHRGGASEANCPDNSMEALDYSIGLGLFATECDIYITKDDQVIVAHADANDRVNGFHPWEATYEQIALARTLDNGETIPTLGQFLDKIVAGGTTRLWMDVKSITAVPAGQADEYSARAAEKASEIIRDKQANHFVEFIVGRAAVLKRCLLAVKGDWGCAYMNTAFSPADFKSNGYAWANFSIDNVFYNNGTVKGDYTIDDYIDMGVKVSIYNADTELNRDWYAAKSNVLYAICTNYPKAMLEAIH